MGFWKRSTLHFQSSLGAYGASTLSYEHDMPFMINGITGWAKIRAQLAVWARTLTLSPMTNPMAFVMISRSRVFNLGFWVAGVSPNTTDSLAVEQKKKKKCTSACEWHNSECDCADVHIAVRHGEGAGWVFVGSGAPVVKNMPPWTPLW